MTEFVLPNSPILEYMPDREAPAPPLSLIGGAGAPRSGTAPYPLMESSQ